MKSYDLFCFRSVLLLLVFFCVFVCMQRARLFSSARYFDAHVKQLQRAAAARLSGGSLEHEFLRHEHAETLLDRLEDIREGRFGKQSRKLQTSKTNTVLLVCWTGRKAPP
jgi:hypothetical protein